MWAVPCSNPLEAEGFSAERSHAFPVPAWDLCSYSSFLPQPQEMHLLDRWIGDYKLTLGADESVNGSLRWSPQWAGDWSSVRMGESPAPWHIKAFKMSNCIKVHSLMIHMVFFGFFLIIINWFCRLEVNDRSQDVVYESTRNIQCRQIKYLENELLLLCEW